MSPTLTNKPVSDYLGQLSQTGFYGTIALKYEGGKVVHLRREENIKPSELWGTPGSDNEHKSS